MRTRRKTKAGKVKILERDIAKQSDDSMSRTLSTVYGISLDIPSDKLSLPYHIEPSLDSFFHSPFIRRLATRTYCSAGPSSFGLTDKSTSLLASFKSPARIWLTVLLDGITMVGGRCVSGANNAADAAREFCWRTALQEKVYT